MRKTTTGLATLLFVSLCAVTPAFAAVTAVNSGAGSNLSVNWSGYIASIAEYAGVSGSWVIPQVNASSLASGDATWVGIGGISSTDLIQSGTQAVVDSAGAIAYNAWYEILPNSSVDLPVSVKPGDSVSVSIQQTSPGVWQISFRDTTTGQNTAISVNYASSLSSAEWIEEMPMIGNGFLPLDDFGSVNFSNGYAIENGTQVSIASSGATAVTMINSNNMAVSVPSLLNPDGASFSVSRTTAPVSVSTSPGEPRVFHGRGGTRTGVGIRGFSPFSVRSVVQRDDFQRRVSIRFVFQKNRQW